MILTLGARSAKLTNSNRCLSECPTIISRPFVERMIRVVENPRQWIGKHGERLFERDAMFLQILGSFG